MTKKKDVALKALDNLIKAYENKPQAWVQNLWSETNNGKVTAFCAVGGFNHFYDQMYNADTCRSNRHLALQAMSDAIGKLTRGKTFSPMHYNDAKGRTVEQIVKMLKLARVNYLGTQNG